MKKLHFTIHFISIWKIWLTWDSGINDDWDNEDNWTPAVVPSGTSTVTIPGGLMVYPKLKCNTMR